ncbi:MAG: D-alanine--D-alanine ligase [Chloroflexi bacterium]|nr:D-alanine--D-alanine ligase [Chloroflexota bacterium]
MSKTRLAVIFGSRSVEHEVSVLTAQQVMAAADPARYELVPIYITKRGDWVTGPALLDLETFRTPGRLDGLTRACLAPVPGQRALVRLDGGALSLLRREQLPAIDVVFPTVHGTHGEDGTLQGLLELADLPYVGAGVAAAAVGMDKILAKAAFQAAGLPVVEGRWYTRSQYQASPDDVVADIEAHLGYPCFVKPAVLGSSIGVARVTGRDDLRFALEVACSYGRRLLVERAVEPLMEINCAVLGNDTPIASVCEQPVASGAVLSFADKYERGLKAVGAAKGPTAEQAAGGTKGGMASMQRIIPAPISEALSARLQQLAIAAFRAIDGAGIARVDFLVSPDEQQVFVNEINTMPGSLSFYLWDKPPTELTFPALVDRLVELALERHRDKQRTTYSHDTDLLRRAPQGLSAAAARRR